MKRFICILIILLVVDILVIYIVHRFELYIHNKEKKENFNKIYNLGKDIDKDYERKN